MRLALTTRCQTLAYNASQWEAEDGALEANLDQDPGATYLQLRGWVNRCVNVSGGIFPLLG